VLTGVAGWATATMLSPVRASDEAAELIERLTGKTPTESDRLHLVMPRDLSERLYGTFKSRHRQPDDRKPPCEAHPGGGAAQSAHRGCYLSLRPAAQPTPRVDAYPPCRAAYVLAVAEMNDGSLLMTKTWVEVATNGCT